MMENDGGDEAARAFNDLRSEVTLLRRAIERLAAESAEGSHAPDYSETLGVISQNLSATAQWVDALVKSPALSLTPEETSRQISAASFDARREDHRLFLAANQGMDEIATRLRHQLESHVMADEQRRRLWQVGFAGLAAGMVLWAIVAGPIARAMPAGWLLPERMAARSLRMPMWEGGQRLMRVSNAEAFTGVLVGNRLVTTNRETLTACHRQAMKAGKAVRCTVEVND